MSEITPSPSEHKPPILTPDLKLQNLIKDIQKAKETSTKPNLDIIPGNKFYENITPSTLNEIPSSLRANIPESGQYLFDSAKYLLSETVNKALKLTNTQINNLNLIAFKRLSKNDLMNLAIDISRTQGALTTGAMMLLSEDKNLTKTQKQFIFHDVAEGVKLCQFLSMEIQSGLELNLLKETHSIDFKYNLVQVTDITEKAILSISKTDDEMDLSKRFANDLEYLVQKSFLRLFNPATFEYAEDIFALRKLNPVKGKTNYSLLANILLSKIIKREL